MTSTWKVFDIVVDTFNVYYHEPSNVWDLDIDVFKYDVDSFKYHWVNSVVNPLHAKNFRGNINIYLHFM